VKRSSPDDLVRSWRDHYPILRNLDHGCTVMCGCRRRHDSGHSVHSGPGRRVGRHGRYPAMLISSRLHRGSTPADSLSAAEHITAGRRPGVRWVPAPGDRCGHGRRDLSGQAGRQRTGQRDHGQRNARQHHDQSVPARSLTGGLPWGAPSPTPLLVLLTEQLINFRDGSDWALRAPLHCPIQEGS
jgi:hypothetical protein